jgi:regulator of sigma E protease
MNILVALFILGIIVIIHELGHFLLAKKNGITVTEFSVGMGPRIASFVRKGTRYSLKLLPIGGSCMMLGEDETVEDEGAFHKKGVWARFSVIFAGAFFNFLLAFVLALILLGNAGVDKPYITGVKSGGPAEKAGLQEGDLIQDINGTSIHFSREIDYFYFFNKITDQPVKITYYRDGDKNTATVTPDWVDLYLLGCTYTSTKDAAKLEAVSKDYPLAKAGLLVGDIITNIDGTDIASGEELAKYFETNPLKEAPVNITYSRDGVTNTASVTPVLERSGYDMGWNYYYYREKVSPLQVVKYSFFEVKSTIVNTFKSVLYLIAGKMSPKEIAGPVGIVNAVGQMVDASKTEGIRVTILSLISFSILISANLGVMNLLPLPALDGGRLVFLLIEAIRRKPVPKEKEAMVHMVGMVLLMILMVFVLYNDIRNIMR